MGAEANNKRVKAINISVKKPTYERVCLSCVRTNPEGSRYCGYCGNPLREKITLESIDIEYLGEETIVLKNTNGYTFSEKDLTVYAKYDDGSKAKIPFSQLKLVPNTIYGNSGSTIFYIKVIYTHNGVTKYGEFGVYCIAPISDKPLVANTSQQNRSLIDSTSTISQRGSDSSGLQPIITRKEPFCLRCDSTRVVLEKKGFSYGKAALGVALVGYAGALAGGIGANDYIYRCLDCGYTTKATY